MHKLACSLVCALMVSSVQAEDTQKSSNVVKLWQSFEKLAKEATKARTAAIQKVRKALQEGKNQQEAIAEYRKEMAKIMGPATKAREAFLEAFGKSDWTSFKGKEHAQMLQAALPGVGQNALSKGKFDQALKAYQALVKLAPKSPSSLRAQLTIGDLLAIQGEVEKAREAYEVVADSDNRTYKRYAAQRLLIGKDAQDRDLDWCQSSEAVSASRQSRRP